VSYVIATGLVSVPLPGVWRRLSLISTDQTISGLDEWPVIGQLEALGIPRHHYGVVRTVQSWRRAAIPPDVAFALWLLRECVPDGGGMPRRRGATAEDTGPTIRYMQLALAAGETRQTDPAIEHFAHWLMAGQLDDGSIPANLGVAYGEVGTTARALRVLRQLDGADAVEAVQRMRNFLVGTCVEAASGRAWSYAREEPILVTGATSLAALALLELDPHEDLLPGVVAFLLEAQEPGGGWSEVPGHEAAIHNTFNVVRFLRAAHEAGIAGPEIDEVLANLRAWFRQKIRRRPPRTALDLAYALRLAAQLDLAQHKEVERIAVRLCRDRGRLLSPTSDLYAETEIAAIAMLECSRHLDTLPAVSPCWLWRWSLPSVPPPFLCRTAYLYELLYGMFRARWWIRTVDYLVAAEVVDQAAGLLLGTVAALGFVDDYVTGALTGKGMGVRGIATIVLAGGAVTLWLSIKCCASSSLLHTLRTSLWSLISAILLTWLLYTPADLFPGLLTVVCLRWLVIDIIAHTAGASGLLDRMIPQ
jgi:hypothetical protein